MEESAPGPRERFVPLPPNGNRKVIIFKDANGIGIMLVARKLVFKDMRSYKFMDFLIIFRLELLDTPGAKLKLQYSKSWKCKLCREKKTANCRDIYTIPIDFGLQDSFFPQVMYPLVQQSWLGCKFAISETSKSYFWGQKKKNDHV